MSLTDYLIIAVIALFLLYAIYDELLMDRLRGKTRLKVLLQRRNKLDSLIFIGLIAILLYHNVSAQGPQVTTTLLMILAFIAIYLFWIRRPKLLLKPQGFFYANVWIAYSRINSMNLSEDGVLVMQLEHRRLLIHVRELDDLERIYKVMVENQ
ncbi:DUF986 family protein [Winslowiella iniecta]|uniref:UPF0266 membrane protein NG42_14165 n=1 Tax=Winslowiella iniecta TaxID=1560201 RepID=A0A0L7TBC8_9GAMM|nr:DUF986 family protein [Winslowiella iniecta]KOC89019.1 hypothetical protein NG42_14165 [Winslowiella iniecta]KOC92667.1 hypothetical protein NG43_12990 [Winslowiella iniecta]